MAGLYQIDISSATQRGTLFETWSESIRFCLAEEGIRLGNVDVVAINQDAGALP